MRFHWLTALALAGAAEAQFILPANPPPATNWINQTRMGLFFDLSAGGTDVTVTHLRTASSVLPGAQFSFEVLTFPSSCLTTPVQGGPTTTAIGWTSLGVADAVSGSAGVHGTSEIVDIPDVVVPAGRTIGVVLRTHVGGLHYFRTVPDQIQTFDDGNLALTTGIGRTLALTPFGLFIPQASLVGELHYVLGPAGGIGASYCGPAVANSTGNPGELTATGSAVAALDDVTLVAYSLPNSSFGYFLASRTQGLVAQPGGSQGVLCLGGGIGRYVAPGQVQSTGTSGGFALALDLTATPTPAGLAAIGAGETWSFQAWYRDQNPSATSNFTDGRAIAFL